LKLVIQEHGMALHRVSLWFSSECPHCPKSR
jgi:hypothetical protein